MKDPFVRHPLIACLLPLIFLFAGPATLAQADIIGAQRLVLSSPDLIDDLTPKMQEILTRANGRRDRDLMVRIWYPAQAPPDADSRKHYGFHSDAVDFAIDPDGRHDILDKLQNRKRRSNTYQNAIPDTSRALPVILYSHGNGNAAEANEPYFEALVARGYIVVSIGHSYSASLVTLQNGRIAKVDSALQDYVDSEIPEEARDPVLALDQASADALAGLPLGAAPRDDLLDRYHYSVADARTGARAQLALWVADIRFVLSALEDMSAPGGTQGLGGLFDLSRIGAVGHSFGGAASRHFCDGEPRCKVSINMDGTDPARRGERIRDPHMRYYFDVKAQVAQEVRDGARRDRKFLRLVRKLFHQRQVHETHAMIAAADSDLVVLSPQKISHLDFTIGWLNLHRYGPGKRVWRRVILHTSLPFLDLHLKPDTAGEAPKEICETLEKPRGFRLIYTNLCG